MRNLRKAALVIALVFSFYALSAQDAAHGIALCEKTEAFLLSLDVSSNRSALVSGGVNDFPYNVIARFPAARATLEATGDSDSEDDRRNVLILAFTMEDAEAKHDFFESTLANIRDTERDYELITLFSYGDRDAAAISGSGVFAQSLENSDDYAALCIGFSDGNEALIIPGGVGTVAPYWLLERTAAACVKSDIPFSLRGAGLGSPFRLNIIASEKRTESFLENEVPCLALSLPQNSDAASAILADFLSLYSANDTEEWSRHYIVFNAGGTLLHVGERTMISIFITIAFATLFAISEFSFITKRRRRIRRDVLRLCYLVPLTVLLSALSFQISQPLARFLATLFGSDVRMRLVIKAASSFIIVTTIYFRLLRWQGILEKNAYSYLLTLVSLVNIFIFTAIDISLFFLFTAEYIVVYASQGAKRVVPLVASFLLMLFPLAPYMVQAVRYENQNVFRALADSSFSVNLLLSFVFMPFLLQWLRIIARLNKKWRGSELGAWRIHVRNAVVSLAAVLLVAALIAQVVRPISERQAAVEAAEAIIEIDDGLLRCVVTDRNFFGDVSRFLDIQLGGEAERCRVIVAGNPSNSVIYSDAQHLSDEISGTDEFLIPSWPSETLQFSYTTDTSIASTITVTALYPNEDGTRGQRTYVVTIQPTTGRANNVSGNFSSNSAGEL